MWGYLARDQYTIPSRIARRLHDLDIDWVETTNLAQSAFNVTQSFNTLVLEIRRGNIPDIVVFMDGNNEIATAFQSGRAGMALNQERINQRVYGRVPITEAVFRRFQFLRRLQRALGLQAGPNAPNGDASVCRNVALYYRNMLHLTETISAAYDLDVHFLWQPILANSRKRLTEWERSITSPVGWTAIVQACTRSVDSTMAESPEIRYRPLHSIFDGNEETVFLDPFGHVTEAANDAIARTIVDLILPGLMARDPRTVH
jgi:hypothetical protein